MLFNPYHEPIEFTISPVLGDRWSTVLDTTARDAHTSVAAGERLSIESRSMLVPRRR